METIIGLSISQRFDSSTLRIPDLPRGVCWPREVDIHVAVSRRKWTGAAPGRLRVYLILILQRDYGAVPRWLWLRRSHSRVGGRRRAAAAFPLSDLVYMGSYKRKFRTDKIRVETEVNLIYLQGAREEKK